jgi:signal transduction histidine kinase
MNSLPEKNRSGGESGSLRRQASVRLVLALSVALALAGATAFWFYQASFEKAAAQKLADTVQHYTTRIGQLEEEWEGEALRLKARLEYSRILEEREPRWIRLNSYLIAQSGSRIFSNVLVASRQGEVLYRYGVNADKLPGVIHQEGYVGWHYDPERATLCRVYRQPIWLGEDGMAWLYLFRPLDNALLYANSFPGTRLFLTRDGMLLSSSLGNDGRDIHPAHSGAVYQDNRRYEQFPLSWGEKDPQVRLVIQQRVESPFTLQEVVYSGILVVLLLSVFLWLVLGRWLTMVARRVSALRRAAQTFAAERTLMPSLTQAIAEARADGTDELSALADTLFGLIEAVARGDRELGEQMVKLTQLNTELNEFTYITSHDLQEPLRKLLIFSEWLVRDLGGNLPESAAKDVTFITDAAARMRCLVEDLLALSRAGNRELHQEPVSLEKVADAALDTLALRIEEKHAMVTRDPLPEVAGDTTLLTQLYQNFISNALKYCDGAPRIHLSAEKRNSEWLLGVRDNGIGINPEYAEQIFQPFKRLHGREKYPGTGIGLAICRKVVERHHGRIWVESREGEGAHFRFTLPA